MAAGNAAVVFKPAVLEAVNLIVGLAGGTGSGKTFSAMRMASGMSRGKRFAVIDTENGRAKHYAKQFAFDHCDLRPPFRPQAYAEAILTADRAGYPVIVVDSTSHEWAGEGGILDWQEEELDRMAGDDYKKREACKMAAWIKPKMDHKKMVQRLLQVRAQLILCFRAEEKVEMARDENGKMKIVPKVSRTGLDGWIPICEKNLPYEMTASFLLTNDAPGMPKPIKLQQQHRALFPLDQPLDEKSGERIAAWAAGDAPPSAGATANIPTVAEYEACNDSATFESLEKRRSDNWRQTPPALKQELKAASDATSKHLSSAVSFTKESAIEALRAAQSVPDLSKAWTAIGLYYDQTGRELEPELDETFKARREALQQL